MNKTINKLLASMLVITLTFANLILLGTYATESLATSVELENQKTLIKDKVDFDAYFLDEKGNKIHTKTIDINSEDENLYLSVRVQQGYLRNATIDLTGANFQIQDVSEKYDAIQGISNNTVVLNQIASGDENILEIPIKANRTTKIDLNDFTKQSAIKISGSSIDNNGRTRSIENTIKTQLNLHGTANPIVEQEITKFTPYHIGENEGFMLQETVKSGIENYTLPIEKTELNIIVPTLVGGEKPSRVNVSANSLNATKADAEGISFEASNWSYDKEQGTVSISVNNEKDQQNMVNWGKDGLDEFVITYIFDNTSIPAELPIHLNSTLNIKAYNNEITEIQKVEEKDITLNQKIGDIVTFAIETTQETLGKGFLYANSNYETEYQTKWIADIGYVDLIDQVTMNQNIDMFLNQNGNEYATTVGNDNYTYYKSTQIAKDNFTKILGSDENAYINIYDKGTNTLIATINKDTPADQNGNIVVNYTMDTNNIYIQTSKPIKEGKLEIQHAKAMKAKTNYSMQQLKSFTILKTDFVGAIFSENTKIVETKETKQINLTEPKTKIDAFVNNTKSTNLSTIVKNENVEFRVVLQNNNITSDLFKNPVVELVFPSYIEEMKISNIGLLFDEELQIDQNKIETYTKEDGRLAMKIPLIGTQTGYNFNQTQNGTNIVINADITVKQLTPSLDSAIEVYVTNENVTTYEQEKDGKAYQELQVSFVAPAGMVTVNAMSAYNDKQEEVISLNGREMLGKIATQASEKNGKVTLTIINNYDATCKNVSVLGRIPFKGNKSIASGEDLGSTFTARMISGIVAESGIDAKNVTVYYTQNENATNELDNPENGWTTDVTALKDMKSYLIVLNDYEMAKGQSLVFSYHVEIPKGLQHNETAFGVYAVIFDKVSEDQTTQDKSISPRVGVSTMDGISLETKMYNNVENNSTIKEGQIIKYTTEVKNVGKTDAENLKVTSKVPEGTAYVVYVPENVGENGEAVYAPARYIEHPEKTTYETTIDTLKAGETKTVSYEVKVLSLDGAMDKKAITSATVSADDFEDVYTTNTVENTIEKGYINITLSSTDETEVIEGRAIQNTVKITNLNNEEKTNVDVTYHIPDGISYVDAYVNDENETRDMFNYDEENRLLTYHLDKLEANKIEEVIINVEIDALGENETEKQIKNVITASCDQTDQKITSNEVSFKIVRPSLTVKQESDIAPGNVAQGDIITYTVKVENHGSGVASNVEVTDYIPDGLRYVKTKYTVGNYTKEISTGSRTAIINTDIPAGETLTAEIKTQVKDLKDSETEKELVNVVKVKADNSKEVEANTITHTVDGKSSNKGENTNGGNSEGNTSYKISGTVWVDVNEDGSKEDEEQKLEGIEVALINTDSNKIVNRTTTDASGSYVFNGLENGRYMVAFMYDSNLYTITEYQKAGVNETRNSDAIENSIVVDNQTVAGAITDNININNSNVYNIDLGVVTRNKFDLSLTKSVSHITVKTTKGTQNYDYKDNTKLAKVDIAPKRIDGASVVIQYKFIVRNEGNVAGCVNKIVDYLPKELKFSTNMNPDWYQAENGAIYNASLSNDMINPGESREVTLTLTKTMTGENTGIINNTAEIYEAYNNLGLADINSTPANKSQGENDIGSADVLITVNTGEPVMYITITIIMLAIFAAGTYIINKKVLKKTM